MALLPVVDISQFPGMLGVILCLNEARRQWDSIAAATRKGCVD